MPAFTELSPSSLPPARLRVKRFDSQMRFSITASDFASRSTDSNRRHPAIWILAENLR